MFCRRVEATTVIIPTPVQFSDLIISVPLPGMVSVGLYHRPPRLSLVTYIPLLHGNPWSRHAVHEMALPSYSMPDPTISNRVKFTFWEEKIPHCIVKPGPIFSALQAM